MSDDLVKRICQKWIDVGCADECFWEGWPECPTPEDSLTPRMVFDRIEELEAKLAMADKLASEFKNCLEVLTKEDDYVCCSGHQCGCYGASLHAQAIYYANEAIDDYHKTTGGKDE